MHELHRCLWNQPQLEQKIFCTADLTLSHWIKLQEELSAAYPTRHCDSYVAANNVSAIKLRILRLPSLPISLDHDLTTPADLQTCIPTTADATAGAMSVESLEDDFGEEDETLDDTNPEFSEIEYFLPSKIRYLDLSELPLSSVPDRCNFPLLIRDEYETMENILNVGLKGRSGSVFLTGQPGIGTRLSLPCKSSDQIMTTGKTSFLYMLLIKRILHGQPTFFQTLGGSVYYISDMVQKIDDPEREVTIEDKNQDPSDIVALVDADCKTGIHTPRTILLCSRNIRVILASSPRDSESRKWLKQLGVPEPSRARIMDIWSEAELVITAYDSLSSLYPSDRALFLRTFLHDHDITFARLIQSMAYFGHSARRTFLACLEAGGIEAQKTVVKHAISNIPDTTSFSNLLSNIRLPNNTSHTLFELSCADPKRLFSMATYHAASTWVLDELLLAYEARMTDAVLPSGAARTFSKQRLIGLEKDVKVWAKKIKQFMVELPKEAVLKTPSPSSISHAIAEGE